MLNVVVATDAQSSYKNFIDHIKEFNFNKCNFYLYSLNDMNKGVTPPKNPSVILLDCSNERVVDSIYIRDCFDSNIDVIYIDYEQAVEDGPELYFRAILFSFSI